MIDTWNNVITWIARLCLHIKYGMSVEDYYQQFTPERWVLSEEGQAFADAMYTMATAGKITLEAQLVPQYESMLFSCYEAELRCEVEP
jgi:hypothetical protein